jgi:hypothetical protein
MVWRPREPEPAKVVDMRQIHIFDHRAFSRRCRKMYGGGFRHLRLAWDFGWRPRLLKPWLRLLMCSRGHHRPEWLTVVPAGRAWIECVTCGHTRTPSEAELEMYGDAPKIDSNTKIIMPDWA